MTLSLGLAIAFTLTFEIPFVKLEKNFFGFLKENKMNEKENKDDVKNNLKNGNKSTIISTIDHKKLYDATILS